MVGSSELISLTARQVVDLLRRGDVSPLELVEAAATRIAATDGELNAIPRPNSRSPPTSFGIRAATDHENQRSRIARS